MGVIGHFFFFSSRRRHTRFDCDWSSDVCSSDLDLVKRCNRNVQRVGNILAMKDTACDVAFGKYRCLFGQIDLFEIANRSEEHTSELQSQSNLVCRLLLEKKKKKKK